MRNHQSFFIFNERENRERYRYKNIEKNFRVLEKYQKIKTFREYIKIKENFL